MKQLRQNTLSVFSYLALMCGITSPAWANVYLPMAFGGYTTIGTAIIPIGLLEAVILWKLLKLPFQKSFWQAVAANAASTLLGLPIAGLTMTKLATLTSAQETYALDTPMQKLVYALWKKPWITMYGPTKNAEPWMGGIAIAVIMFSFFLASWGSEYLVLKSMNRKLEHKAINRACLAANAASYLALIAFNFLPSL